MIIRKCQPNDLEGLTELMVDLGYPTDLEKLGERLDKIHSTPMYSTFVAELNDNVVGMIGVRQLHSYENDEVVTQISALVTKSEYQGRGVGKALVSFVEEWAVSIGSTVLVLTSGIKEERMKAHNFYNSIGFEVTGYRFVKRLCK